MLQVVSYQIADSIDVKLFRAAYKDGIYYADSDELFYVAARSNNVRVDTKTGDGAPPESYVYVFKYGVVCFLNFDEAGTSDFLQLIAPYCKNLFEQKLSEEFQVETNAGENKFGFSKIEIMNAEIETLRLIMLNVSQSVALDYYSEQTNLLLEETNYHTQSLERRGKLDVSGTNLKKYIGKTLNLKNRIADNLYIFDSPPETWEDENLNKIDIGMKRTFDLQDRYRDIREGLEIIKENLELFKDLLQYRQSTFLEWIVIMLIFLEVLNLVIDRFVK